MSGAPTFASRIGSECTALAAWWLQELREFGEDVLARVAPRLLTRTRIELDRDGGRIFTVHGKEQRLAVEFSCETPGSWPESLEPFGSTEFLRGARAVIAVGAEYVLVHRLMLPASLERELDQVVPLQLERELPLPPERIVIDWRRARQAQGERRLAVDVLVVHRELLERLQTLAQGWQVRIARLSLLTPAGELMGNFLKPRLRDRILNLDRPQRWLARSAATLAVLWGLIVGGHWVYERVRVERALREVTAPAARADTLLRQVAADAAPGASLVEVMRQPDALDVLEGLTDEIPADSWAYEVEVTAKFPAAPEIRLSAFTPTATMLVDLLRRSGQLDHVRLIFASSAGLGFGDRLQLTARWVVKPATPPRLSGHPARARESGESRDPS